MGTHAMLLHGYKLSDDFGMVPRTRKEMIHDALTFLGVAVRCMALDVVRQRPVNFVGRSK